MIKILVAACVALVIAGLFYFDVNAYLTLEALQQGRDALESVHAENPLAFPLVFFVAYFIVAATSIPGAAVMTLAAGMLFGLLFGTVLVSFASTLGATAAFLISRYLFRDSVERRFRDKLKAINDGLQRDGIVYLLTLRLVPLFPYFVINLVMGLTRIRWPVFYSVSQIGMLPGTLVYINAGRQLGSLQSVSDILSVRVIGAFVLLALFPWFSRWAAGALRRRRLYARWSRPRRFDCNLVVIGAGAAGLVTAYAGAAARARVALVEANRMGGDCLNFGCVPSKTLIRSGKAAAQMRVAQRYGLRPAQVEVDFRAVMQRIQASIRAIEPHDSVERYRRLGVDTLLGHGVLVDPWTVEVALRNGESRRLTTRSIVIAAGARPFVPELPGLEDTGYVTSDTVWDRFADLDAAPPRLVVLGGGPIGCELAQAFARLGSNVTQVEMQPRLLGREDEDVSALVEEALTSSGVTVLAGYKALRCERHGACKTLIVERDGAQREIEFDELICAVGRVPRVEGFGLEALGIAVSRTIVANEYLQTDFPNILVAGDVAGPYQLTHVAGHQGWYAAMNALFGGIKRFKVDYSAVPWTTFVDPEVARVGLNEQEAAERDVPHEVTKYSLAELDRAITDDATAGFVKVLTVPGGDRILGVTIVAEHAGDLLAEFVLAIRHGLGLKKILGTIHSYPTFAEANRSVAGQWRRAHMPGRILDWLERYHAWRRAW